ncbi:type II toxin-antitoxin system VapC family toxin [Nitrococcus mobilis]|uniref:PIN domain-containing protein n=1 Tax=Nitrococcus mobilis Nb-231 TaxID=314278 RepID=A4BRN8_9GAMM|nr:PIN domain-containing protein [Nitrococcus mobilis]EAR21609.1 hypothetical protein NB231_02543 [Nitrococcus mobilis Nb-231]
MASIVYLDTHVVAWLYGLGAKALSAPAADVVRSADSLRISPMVRLELQYLYEIGRLAERPAPVLDELNATLGLSLCQAPFAAAVHRAAGQNWTRDPFDRLIVAQAALHDAMLVTKDKTMHTHYARAIW